MSRSTSIGRDPRKEYVKVAVVPVSCSDSVGHTGVEVGVVGLDVQVGRKVLTHNMSNQHTLSHTFDTLTNSTSGAQDSFDHESLSIVFRMLADEH